ncbi:D-alanyl-D-alanine carboxypeptidase/D-alanyl-D-alanine endopeptidase [Thermostaphylospora chromogena]|uniref:D-alanyl-D-alanine carboxypeptidase / D-alanyl-D-alanine-endopeptidase (Penicillin-binding protein 4) n=1 Tax=Thermostaphylospora chromogena TaxID=35622 RepID=A0A1H1C628_9ACTN|nr:D-alanyl-D-alanine carboxypeptidase/D-alanyl-D-alanine-endopeptidase [Thermostaphylospora chromogena]SDQ59653.1 D-alanyl-D-alanine carboxypeptidase / D-alanyl-D-alanine-endopeptidase (penicillin-binding protein 4) [Thermostaphylospora chromogena]
MKRHERGVALVTLALLQVFAIAAGVYVLAAGVDLTALTKEPPRPIASAEPPSIPVVTAGPVLAAGGNGPLPTKGTLTNRLDRAVGDPALGRRVAAAVVDVATGTPLYTKNADVGITPASTTKLVTSVAALASLGPDARLRTSVVQGATANSVILVGGGDPTLATPKAEKEARKARAYPAEASLAKLAERTARTLKAEGITKVTLAYDDSLYTGSALGPGWKPGYVPEGSVAPVSALAVDEGRQAPGIRTPVPDPARTAATAFARLLDDKGVRVSGKIKRAKAGQNARELAAVTSAPMYALVERVLTRSDNDLAEALARHVAIKEGQPASFEGVARAVRQVMQRLNVGDGIEIYDGSGLSTRNRITPAALTRLLATAASPANPHLRAAIGGMPVAGFTGTLDRRFSSTEARAGVGLVRAKTGTLNGVNTLAGVVTTEDGRLLAFAFMADRVSGGWDRAEAALDRLAAIVSEV